MRINIPNCYLLVVRLSQLSTQRDHYMECTLQIISFNIARLWFGPFLSTALRINEK